MIPTEIALTVLVPFGIVSAFLTAMAVATKFKKWQARRKIDQSFTEYLRLVRS